MIPHYYLDLTSIGLVGNYGVNDVPVVTDPKAEGVRTIMPVNTWLKPSGTQLTVSLQWPRAVPYKPGQGTVTAQIFRADPNSEVPVAAEVLAEVVWPAPGTPEEYPQRVRVPFNLPASVATQLWNEAPVLPPLTDVDKAALLALVERFRQALISGNPEEAYGFMKYKFEDFARAEGHTVASIREVVLEQYQEMLAEPNRESAPLTADMAVFDLVAGSRLVRIARPNDREAVIIETENSQYSFVLYATKIAESWTLVR
jgi:hypothetical protein